MKIKDVIHALERFAPLPLQEDYDNAGLQVGLTEAEVSGALLCLDVTEQVINEAEEKGCNMIVSHHPLIFRKLACISDCNDVQRCVFKAIQRGITIVSMHTNLDSAEGGVNYMIARQLDITHSSITQIGNQQDAEGVKGSNCIIGELSEPISAKDYIYKIKNIFNAGCVMTNELLTRPIKKIAICGGAGSFMLHEAIKAGADAFLTGEMHYHDYFGHEDEIQITVIGHYESEQYTKELLAEIIGKTCPDVRTVITAHNTNPIRYW